MECIAMTDRAVPGQRLRCTGPAAGQAGKTTVGMLLRQSCTDEPCSSLQTVQWEMERRQFTVLQSYSYSRGVNDWQIINQMLCHQAIEAVSIGLLQGHHRLQHEHYCIYESSMYLVLTGPSLADMLKTLHGSQRPCK